MKLIADGGSTSTKWALIDGSSIEFFNSKGLNLHYISELEVVDALIELKSKLKKPVTAIYFYGSGITSEYYRKQLIALLKEYINLEAKIFIDTDLIAACRALFGNEEGIAGILGTGASTCHFDGSRIKSRIPSLGFWLGDEGSGADLGKRLIKAYLRKELPEKLILSFENEFGKFDRDFIFEKMKNDSRPNTFFAKFSTFLKNNEDEIWVKELVSKAFEEFIQHNLLAYEISDDLKIGFVGSVAFHFSDLLKKLLAVYFDNEIVIIQNPIESLVNFHVTNVQ
jgi:glucosamine kinase